MLDQELLGCFLLACQLGKILLLLLLAPLILPKQQNLLKLQILSGNPNSLIVFMVVSYWVMSITTDLESFWKSMIRMLKKIAICVI